MIGASLCGFCIIIDTWIKNWYETNIPKEILGPGDFQTNEICIDISPLEMAYLMFNPLNITTMVNQNVALSELSVDKMTTTEGGFFVEAGLILLLLIAGTQKAF